VIRGQKKKYKSFPKIAFSGTADSQAVSKAQEAVALLNKSHQVNLQNMQMLGNITKISQFTMVLSGLNLFATVVGFAIMNEKLNKEGLYITDVNIINFDFSEAFITAIEEKQVAQQQLLKAETDKQRAITNAQADAESTRIKAEGEADANKTIAASLTDQVIEYLKIQKWDGILPQVTGTNGAFVNIDPTK